MTTPDLRDTVQGFVRRFGLLAPDRTPCGETLPPATAHALLILLAEEAPTQQELAGALNLDKSNVARLCQRLESAGHVTRAVDAHDRRLRRVHLTTKGRRLATRVDTSSRARFRAVVAGLTRRECEQIVRALGRLNAAIDASAVEEVAA